MTSLLKRVLYALTCLTLVFGGSAAMLAVSSSNAGADTASGSWNWNNTKDGGTCHVTGYHTQNLYGYAVGNTTTSGPSKSCYYAYVEVDYFYLGDSTASGTNTATATSPYQTYPTQSFHSVCGDSLCATGWYLY